MTIKSLVGFDKKINASIGLDKRITVVFRTGLQGISGPQGVTGPSGGPQGPTGPRDRKVLPGRAMGHKDRQGHKEPRDRVDQRET
jgi:hypothetical protein